MDITPYLKLMADKNASDLFITANSTVKIKLEGQIVSVGETILTGEVCKTAAYKIMNDKQKSIFEETLECDFAVDIEDGSARFRVNIFRQKGEISMVFRFIPVEIPTIDDMDLPKTMKDIIGHNRGLVLVVGRSGSGKSTTLAAMINHRNQNMAGHILSIEDPIEFRHPNLKSILSQREIGVDTLSYRNALRSAMREAPDVIFIGEIRDRETTDAAIALANTGHLAISTLHANNSSQALERMINMFPEIAHKQLFADLSLNLRSIIALRLVMGVNGKRCMACEILINTSHIAALILKGDIDEVKETMGKSSQGGMQTFDEVLLNLYKKNRIEFDEALNNSDSRTNLEAKINFS